MSLSAHGGNTSSVEVTNISGHGFWLLVDESEYFLSYKDFPWFRDQSVSRIVEVEQVSTGYFYWPELDVDLSLASIQNPQQFPLKARQD